MNAIYRKAKLYLEDVKKLATKVLRDNLVSIVIFGSLVRNELSRASDVDILIVVRKYDSNVRRLIDRLRILEFKYGFSFIPRGFFGKLFYALSRVTGVFRSTFVAELNAIRKWDFVRIFGTSRFMTRLLAPTEAVKFTILSSYKIIYGSDPFDGIEIKNPSYKEIIRSFLMNLLLACASFILLPLHRETYKFIYEAIKWSLFNYAYVTRQRPKIKKLSRIFYAPLRRGIENFITTRRNGRLSPGLLIYAIPSILKIHIWAIRELKKYREMQISR